MYAKLRHMTWMLWPKRLRRLGDQLFADTFQLLRRHGRVFCTRGCHAKASVIPVARRSIQASNGTKHRTSQLPSEVFHLTGAGQDVSPCFSFNS